MSRPWHELHEVADRLKARANPWCVPQCPLNLTDGALAGLRDSRRPGPNNVNTFNMTWNRDEGPPPRGYHHGNLKETLIRAALDLIARKGPSGFTFAEAARFAGVSPAAPYRHFRDRDELLSSIARGR